jgi:hypothetical protein
MTPLDLLHEVRSLSVRELAVTHDLVVAADATAPMADGPAYGCPSDPVHSGYTRIQTCRGGAGRSYSGSPSAGSGAGTPGRLRAIFAERLPDILAPHTRATDWLTLIRC